jgi:hypothetical protein
MERVLAAGGATLSASIEPHQEAIDVAREKDSPR